MEARRMVNNGDHKNLFSVVASIRHFGVHRRVLDMPSVLRCLDAA